MSCNEPPPQYSIAIHNLSRLYMCVCVCVCVRVRANMNAGLSLTLYAHDTITRKCTISCTLRVYNLHENQDHVTRTSTHVHMYIVSVQYMYRYIGWMYM